MRRIGAVLVILVSLFGSLFAAHAQQTLPLRIGYQTGDINVQLMYAINTGLFDKMRIDAKLVPFPAGPAMLPALAASEIDLAWMGEFPVVTGYSNGMGIEIIMMERIDTTNVRLVVNAATGAQTVADLNGKKIGGPTRLQSGDQILLCNRRLTFHVSEAQLAEPAAAG